MAEGAAEAAPYASHNSDQSEASTSSRADQSQALKNTHQTPHTWQPEHYIRNRKGVHGPFNEIWLKVKTFPMELRAESTPHQYL